VNNANKVNMNNLKIIKRFKNISEEEFKAKVKEILDL